MPLSGTILKGVGLPSEMDWSRTQIVLVTGDFPNECGHVLLYVGGSFGHYFHFDGPWPLLQYPLYLKGDSEYRAYVKGTGKEELIRKKVAIPEPFAAQRKLNDMVNARWSTAFVSHNCATFVQAVIREGGNFWTFPDECPLLLAFKILMEEKIFHRDTQFPPGHRLAR